MENSVFLFVINTIINIDDENCEFIKNFINKTYFYNNNSFYKILYLLIV